MAGDGLVRFQDFRVATLKYNTAAGCAVAGSQIDNLIGRAHHIGFVLDDHHSIAGVSETFQQAHQLCGVTRMQTDTGLIEDKQRVHQAGSEAGRQTDPLGFTARK